MPFENQLEITFRAFFFNAERDYLPYYKNFSFRLNNETQLKEVLPMIQEKNRDFSYPDKDLLFRVNDVVVTGEETIKEIVAELGSELTIDPALTYRSDNGLILNNKDFIHNFRSVFKRHLESREDLEYYTSLYPQHYASETLQYNREYLGDAILLTAYKMIKDGSEFKEEILEAINDKFNGIRCCEYENNVFQGKDYRAEIDELKEMINLKQKETLMDKLSTITLRQHQHEVETVENATVALYLGDTNSNELVESVKASIEQSSAKYIEFKMATKLAGQSILNSHRELAYLKAGTMLLDALDSGADILLFNQESDLTFFRESIAQAERAVGRDIELKLLTVEEFNTIAKKQVA